jgi:hypothetical protein
MWMEECLAPGCPTAEGRLAHPRAFRSREAPIQLLPGTIEMRMAPASRPSSGVSVAFSACERGVPAWVPLL